MSDAVNNTVWSHFIAGRYTAPGLDTLREVDPRTGQLSHTITAGTPEDVDAAVLAARAAYPEWAELRPINRGRILTNIAQALRARLEEFVAVEHTETGKPPAQVRGDVDLCAQYFEFYAGLVNTLGGRTIDLGAGYHSYTRNEPYGVVGVILPWNAPMNQFGRSVAPAIAAGNAVVVKPSEFTSVATLMFAKLCSDNGLPDGIVNVVTGRGAEAGNAVVTHPLVRKISFTGSVRAGREIGKVAADRLLPLGLELGGKSPNIVFADCDFDLAVAGAQRAFTFNSGQACSAGSRLLIERSLHDRFVQALKERIATAQVGSDNDTDIGPIITQAQYERVLSYEIVAEQEGVERFVGGVMPKEEGGWYLRPSILTGVTNDMRVAQEEIFGPVLAVIPFDTEDEAIRLANDTEYGLVAGLWTRDVSRVHRVAAALEAGQIFVNEYFAGGVETPFGGYKNSGYGREKGIEGLHHFTQLKCVTIAL